MRKNSPHHQRRRRAAGLVKERNGSAVLVTSPTNIHWLTGFSGEDSWLLLNNEEAVLLTDFRFRQQAHREMDDGVEISSEPSPLAGLRGRGKKLSGKLLVEDTVSLRTYGRIAEALDHLELEAVTALIESLRERKDGMELEALREAAGIADAVMAALQENLRPGLDDHALIKLVRAALEEEGAQPAFPPIAAIGPDSALPHARPGGRKTSPGSIVLLDLGARWKGYCSDLTRTFACGEPSREFFSRYQAVLAAQEAGLNAIRPGREAREVDAAARRVLAQAGLGEHFGHSLGHGVGLEIHESPSLSSANRAVLEEGMVVTVEPGIYLPGWGGIRIEDTILVTRDGAEPLTKSPKKLDKDPGQESGFS